jgi:adenylate cyclase
VQRLAAGARRIEAGDYQQSVAIPLHDEIGALAQAFNGMAKGLAEKERVRNLLGKVVSPEVASELLKGDIELGGEEREVTVLFSDVRGFTSLCEGQSPKQVLSLLNDYFSAITAVIEANGGVVDKFIGDAVMALFGAPVAQADSAERALRTAFGMEQALVKVNADFAARGLPPLAIGIGINTGKVVAGNMGSPSRLNYTVIGDGVNLASRLEGLTKQHGATIIVSEACARAAPGFTYRELGVVQVKGRQEPVRIFVPSP